MAKRDPFKDLRPKTANVAVGMDVLQLRTATLDQEAEILAAVGELDLGGLFEPLAEMLSGETEQVSATQIMLNLGKVGPKLWKAAQRVLGRQLSKALREACTASLHTAYNADMLKEAGKITDAGGFDNDGVFSCPPLRAYIRQNITLLQATAVLKEVWTLNSYGEALGNLIPLLGPEEPAAETTASAVS